MHSQNLLMNIYTIITANGEIINVEGSLLSFKENGSTLILKGNEIVCVVPPTSLIYKKLLNIKSNTKKL